MRSLAEQYWPSAGPDVLAQVPLVGHGKLTHTLRDLVPHRDALVHLVLEESIHAYLQRATFDSVGEVRNHISSLGVELARVRGNFNDLKELIQRRHHIVHQADRGQGVGVNSTKPISRPKLADWLLATREIGRSTIELLP